MYGWWLKSGEPVEVGTLSHYSLGFLTSQVVQDFKHIASTVSPIISLRKMVTCHCYPTLLEGKLLKLQEHSSGARGAVISLAPWKRGWNFSTTGPMGNRDYVHEIRIPKKWTTQYFMVDVMSGLLEMLHHLATDRCCRFTARVWLQGVSQFSWFFSLCLFGN